VHLHKDKWDDLGPKNTKRVETTGDDSRGGQECSNHLNTLAEKKTSGLSGYRRNAQPENTQHHSLSLKRCPRLSSLSFRTEKMRKEVQSGGGGGAENKKKKLSGTKPPKIKA